MRKLSSTCKLLTGTKSHEPPPASGPRIPGDPKRQ